MSERLDGCAEFDARLLEGAFAPSPDARLDAHLAGCARCRRARDRYLATADALAAALAPEGAVQPQASSAVPGHGRRRAWLLAGAATLAAAAVAAWIALRPADVSVTTFQGAVASFEDVEHVRLEAGSARFQVRRGSLEVATPLGTVRCASGAFTVEIRQSEEEGDMKHPRVAATSVAIAVTAGMAWWMSGGDEVAIPAGASLVEPASEPVVEQSAETTPIIVEPVEALEGSSRVSAAAPPQPVSENRPPLPEVTIFGRVVDVQTRVPVPGAEVLIVQPEGPRRTMAFRATSDGEGRFAGKMEETSPVSIDRRLGDGSRSRLLVLADGYAALRGTPEDLLRETTQPPKQLEGGFEWDLGDIPLTRGTLVRGRVVWAVTGEPIGGARLMLLTAHPRERGAISVLLPSLAQPLGATLADGSFSKRIASSKWSGNPVLYALCERGLGWTDLVVLEGRGDMQIEIGVQPPLALEVAVRTEDGRPIAGALVRAEPGFAPLVNPWEPTQQVGLGLDMELVGLFSQTTDEKGLAIFASLPPPDRRAGLQDATEGGPGLYNVVALKQGFIRTRKDGVQIRRGERARVELAMRALSLRSISGRIFTMDGVPIEGAHVAISGGGTALELSSDAEGRYAGSGLDPSWPDLHLVIEATGFAKRIVTVRLPEDGDLEDADFELGHTLPIEGRVVDDLGRPVAGARVSITRGAVFQPFGSGHEGTGPDGRFEFPGADEGEWLVTVWAPEPHGEWERRLVTTSARGGDLSVEVILRRVDPLEGTRMVAEVVDALTGHPLDPGEVMVLPRDRTDDKPTRSVEIRRESGRLIAERLPVGAWRVWVQVRGRPNAFADVDVARGAPEIHARIEVGEPGAIAGRVRFDARLLFRPCRVYGSLEVSPSPGGGHWREGGASTAKAEVLSDGSFLLEGLTPGPWRLSLLGADVLAESSVIVPSGGTARAEILPVLAARLAFRGLSSRGGNVHFGILRQGDESFSTFDACEARKGELFERVRPVLPGKLRWRAWFTLENGRPWAETQEGELEPKAGETIEIEVPVVLLPEDG